MKHLTMLNVLAMTAALTLGGIGHASAMTPLAEGDAGTHLIPTVNADRYGLQLVTPARVSIRSEGWDTHGIHMRLQARLLDEHRNVVLESRQEGGHFMIDDTLAPGDYTLEVRGVYFGRRHANLQHYRLKTRVF
ncbi:hypothetical protein [Onishia taeanensis]